MQGIQTSVEREAREGCLALTPKSTRRILEEVYMREELTRLLLLYAPRWLQLGLGVVLGTDDNWSFEISRRVHYRLRCYLRL